MNQRPLLEVVAGPNGSGKSTFAESYLVRVMNRESYLNPDIIAAGVAPGDTDYASFRAGRILLREIKSRIANKEELGFESTLSGTTYLKILKSAKAQGYLIRIYFISTDKSRTNVERIKKRVEMGGHHIPTRDVLRRYKRSFQNFWNLYRPLSDEWIIFNNSGPTPVFVASNETFEKLDGAKQLEYEKQFLKGRLAHAKQIK